MSHSRSDSESIDSTSADELYQHVQTFLERAQRLSNDHLREQASEPAQQRALLIDGTNEIASQIRFLTELLAGLGSAVSIIPLRHYSNTIRHFGETQWFEQLSETIHEIGDKVLELGEVFKSAPIQEPDTTRPGGAPAQPVVSEFQNLHRDIPTLPQNTIYREADVPRNTRRKGPV